MGGITKMFRTGASSAKRAAEEAAKDAERQHQETLAAQRAAQAQQELQQAEANRISAEMAQRAQESQNLMENQMKISQTDSELADVVIGGSAEEDKDKTRKRRQGSSNLLSGTLGIGGV